MHGRKGIERENSHFLNAFWSIVKVPAGFIPVFHSPLY